MNKYVLIVGYNSYIISNLNVTNIFFDENYYTIIGTFSSEEEAINAYKKYKENIEFS